jgi:colicin import membrane protein
MNQARRDQWLASFLSVMVHGLIIGAIAFTGWHFIRPTRSPMVLPIEGSVVHESAPPAAPQAAPPEPVAPPVPVVTQPAPQPDPAVEAHRAEERRIAEHQEQELARAKAAREAEAQAQAEADAQAKAKAAQQAREQARKDAEQRAAELARQQAAKDKAQREAELRDQMAAEERLNAARTGGQEAQYKQLLYARITNAWIRPPSAQPGVVCVVHVTQVPGGEVTGVTVGTCNGDAAVRESVEAAVYRASPLPAPPTPDLFEREFTVNFAPTD